MNDICKPVIYIHDDDHDLMKMLSEMLSLMGYRCFGSSCPLEPDRKSWEGVPDLFLLDLMLSREKSGIELVDELRASGMGAPIIAMTASGFLAEEARKSGKFVQVIEKPDDMSEARLGLFIHDAIKNGAR